MIGGNPRIRAAHLTGILEEMQNEVKAGDGELRDMVTNHLSTCFLSLFLPLFL